MNVICSEKAFLQNPEQHRTWVLRAGNGFFITINHASYNVQNSVCNTANFN